MLTRVDACAAAAVTATAVTARGGCGTRVRPRARARLLTSQACVWRTAEGAVLLSAKSRRAEARMAGAFAAQVARPLLWSDVLRQARRRLIRRCGCVSHAPVPPRLELLHYRLTLVPSFHAQAFLAVFKTLTDEIIAAEEADHQASKDRVPRLPALNSSGQTKDAVAWLREMFEYNVPLGKLNRGLAVLDGASRGVHGRQPP